MPREKSNYEFMELLENYPGVALVNISNGQIFTGKDNTDIKWNIEVAQVEEKIFERGTIFCEIAS